jgi:hypothetical protein
MENEYASPRSAGIGLLVADLKLDHPVAAAHGCFVLSNRRAA